MSLYPNLEQISLLENADKNLNSKTKLEQKFKMSKLSIELVKDMLIKFDGTKSKLFEFVDNCDKAFSIIKEEQKDLLFTLIETKLTDNARSIVRNRHFDKWEELRQFLLDAYSDRRTSSQWQLELNSCRQNLSEPVLSYSTRVENCYLKLINTLNPSLDQRSREACVELLKEQALNVFISGLQRDLCILVKSQKPSSLEEAIAIAQNEEQEIKSKNEMNKLQNLSFLPRFCTYCNKPGHIINNCRNRNHLQQKNQNIRHVTQNHSYQNPKPPNFKFCNYCKKQGHVINECRKRQYNNDRNSQNQSRYQNKNPQNDNRDNQTRNFQIRQNNQSTTNSLNDQGTAGSDSAEKRPSYQSRISTINHAVTTYVSLKIPKLYQNPSSFLLDTGADISLIKLSNLRDDILCYEDNLITLKGIDNTANLQKTLCYCYLPVDLDNTVLNHCFHVVPDNFPIPFDGLLGNDFVKANQCEINYNTNTLLIGAHTIDLQHIVQPIQNSDVFNNNPKPKSELVLKPRSETMVQIKIINSDLNEGICEHIQLLEDVFVCPSIVKVTNGQIITFLNKEEKESLIEICHEYNNIFYLEEDKLSYTNAIMHEIPMTSCSPVNTKTYRYPEVHKEEVNKQINKMLEDEIIQPSTSPWNSPVWVVPKKPDASGKKKWRIDYRKVNELSIGDSFPLLNITDILDQLGHSKYFTTIDLTSGFHQIQMAPQDAEKTAFSTPMGHYQFNRMPFGLRNAPATFQRLMNTVLTGIQNIKCFVYLDDIVVFSDNLENHNKRLIEVFQRLSEYNLKIQPDKCEFLRKEVMYLGHLITDEGVKPDANKVKAVREFPVPKSPKDIKSFLGLAGYYRRFIPNFSNITKPLTKLLKKDICFAWTSLQQDAFEKLKDVLCSEPLLQYCHV